ncbi:MAG: hypothetical protein LBG29_07730, partial [Synergistaceae bacterium]|nr:hypothetical protein [Synergistaceae bacterium]
MRKKDFALWVLLAVFAFVLMAGGCGGGGGDGNSWTAGTVDFSDLAGSYTAQPGGSGILTINGERIDLTLLSANAVISSIQSSGTNSASAILSAESEVEAYYGGSTLDTFSETHEDETITITRTDDNKFKWADPDGG